ncbi:MAG: 6-bladed beta-propeller [Gemmatimonadota bacterium]|nr:6-bladed beta-propeller [Gemmatimonadota bacterium]MXX33772.1 6-bladed beta-propeller [Gemmatimonadota bacterium]MYD14246.1 6-bladed beta-propeller [Gemmatimonadota bacterium]
MSKRIRLATVVTLALAAAGCEQESPGAAATAGDAGVTAVGRDVAGPDAGVTIRDSAGIEVVENHAPQWPAGQFWTIDPEPEFVLGGSNDINVLANDSSQLIWEVVGLARLEDGRVAVLSSANEQLYLFEPSGALSGTIGREGEGPGEFTRPEHLQYLPPDTLVVWDYHMRSIDYFDTGGTLLRERKVDYDRLRERVYGATSESLRRPLPDGSFIVSVRSSQVNADSSLSDCPPGRSWGPPLGPGGVQPGPAVARTWPARAYLRVDSAYSAQRLGCSGMILAGGDPPLIHVRGTDGNEIRQLTLDGILLRIIRRTTEPVPITARARRAEEDRVFSEFEARDLMPPPRGAMAEVDTRTSYAWVAGLMVDTEGYLWVQEWSASESGRPDQWSVLSPEGRWLGVVPMPVEPGPMDPGRCSGFSSCWIDREFYVTLRVDELGVERIEGYRIRRGG